MDKSALYDRIMKLVLEHKGNISVDKSGYLTVYIKEFSWTFVNIPTVDGLLDCQIRLEAYLLKGLND